MRLLSRGSYGDYVAVTGFPYFNCVRVPLFSAKIALRGSHGTALREGVIVAYDYTTVSYDRERRSA